MFVIRKSQLEPFRLLHREKVRQQAITALQSDGVAVDELPDGRSFVSRDGRGAQTTLTYSDRLLPQAVTKPLGERYNLTYDEDGRLSQLDYPNGERVQLARTPNGLITRLQTAPGQVYALDYRRSLLNRVTYPGGTTQQFSYDAKGLLTHLTDRNGHTRQYLRDPIDGKLLGLVDELGRTTQFAFEDGHLTGVIFPDGSRQTVSYDEADDSLFVTLRDGKEFIQSYEGDDLRELNWQDGPWTRFTHDRAGRPLTIETPDSDVSFGYGSHGLTSERGVLGTAQLSYDSTGQLTGVQLPAGLPINYGYDLNGRLNYIDIDGQRIRYEYDSHDLLTGIAYPNGLHQQVTHQHLGGLLHTRLTDAPGKPLYEQHYAYDAQQRLVSIVDDLSGQEQQLHYDAESRLLSVTDSDPKQRSEQFRYDAAGGLSSLNGWPVQTGPMGEIRAVGPDGWQYDGLGNATRLRGPHGVLELDFARNSTLRSLRVNEQVWQYTYDGLGRRIAKTNGTERWQFGWLEGRLVTETYQPGPQASVAVREYIYHPDQPTPVAFVEDGQLYTLLTDGRGAVTHAFDASGQLAWHGRYQAYGTCEVLTERVRQPLRLPGQYADAESGLYYNVGRYYAPFVGAYVSLDPQWFETLDTHPYAYARSNPFGRHDPLGDLGPLAIIGGAALLGGVISAGVTAYQGGSWRQIGASFVHGALSGAGAAAGAMLGGVPGLMAGAAAGGFLGTLAEQAINGEQLCLPCAFESAVIEGLLGGAFGLAGKLLGPIVGPLASRLAGAARSALGRMGQAIKGVAGRAVDAVRRAIGKSPTTGSKPYVRSRPSYGKGQVDEVWENAKQPDGKVYDPNTGEEITWDRSRSRTGQWDMGHNPGKEYRKLHKDYMDGKITKEEFLRQYRNPRNYQPELPGNNRSHRYEQN